MSGVFGLLVIAAIVYSILFLTAYFIPRVAPTPYGRRVRIGILWFLSIYPLSLLLLTLMHIVLPQQHGLLAVTQTVAPYLFLPLVLLIPFLWLKPTRLLRIILALCLIIFCLRFLSIPDMNNDPFPETALRVKVLNWNVGIAPGDSQNHQQQRVRPVLLDTPADLVVLEEAYWGWLDQDSGIAERYPYRIALVWNAQKGLVLLSRYPIIEHNIPQIAGGIRDWPRHILARLDLGGGRDLNLLAAHPPAPSVSRGCLLRCLDTTVRDTQLRQIRGIAAPLVQEHKPLLMVGDFNLTRRDPLYTEIGEGLNDVYESVGFGIGGSWPILPHGETPFAILPPLLRIDHIFISPALIPLTLETNCSSRGSDHCSLLAEIAVP